MALAQIGPLTTVLEAAATAVAAGVALGGVAAGILGLIRGWSRTAIEGNALASGYVGGGVGAALALLDLILRYGLSEVICLHG